MDEEESTVQSTAENMEPAETEENAGEETDGQNVEDHKSEGDKLNVDKSDSDKQDEAHIDDDDKFAFVEFGDDPLEQRIELGKTSGVGEEFELLETSQQTEEEEREKQRELMDVMESTQIAPDSSEDEDEKKEDKKEDRGQEEEEATEGKQLTDKESLFTKGRGSIFYDMGPRIRDLEDVGDFFLTDDDAPLKYYNFLDEKAEEECEEEIEYEEEEVAIDRTPYYEKHEVLKADILKEKIKNNILQKKLAKFFKRRKMEHVLKETDQQVDTLDKYGKKLIAFGELSEIDNNQRTAISSELKNLKSERDCKLNDLNKMFKGLITQEKDTGYGLIYTKTGKPIPDKLVERMLHRQKQQIETVGDMRLKHIQLKNMVLEKQNAISQLDKIGDNLYLMDYEQLKVENRSYMDKMEEKDEELSRLRTKCQKTIQILAHMREKSSALECDIKYWNSKLQSLKNASIVVRAELNEVKQQRDYYRNMRNKLRDESGLLVESELLRDMELSKKQLESMIKELENLKEEHKTKAQQIRNIRKNIEYPPERVIKKPQKDVSDMKTHGKRLYKGRPSLHPPTLPEDAFKHLRNFRRKPKFYKKKRKSTNL